MLSKTEKNQELAAAKAGMDPTTARRYLGLERLPSELKKERPWRTREDPFCEVWDAVQRQIQESPGQVASATKSGNTPSLTASLLKAPNHSLSRLWMWRRVLSTFPQPTANRAATSDTSRGAPPLEAAREPHCCESRIPVSRR